VIVNKISGPSPVGLYKLLKGVQGKEVLKEAQGISTAHTTDAQRLSDEWAGEGRRDRWHWHVACNVRSS
jgi:hypothetical protein